MRRRALLAVALAGLLAAACSGGDDADDDGASLGVTVAPTEVTAPPVPAESPPGTGVVVVGGSTSSFAVTECRLEADPSEPEGAQTLVLITGSGTTAGGVGFDVEILRFATGTDVKTFTDTISYTDTAKILQAQRIEVGGQVSDPRDPDEVARMIRTRDAGVSANGLAGPPGGGPDTDGTVGFAIDATCAP
jgi:hypothetical protein